MDRNTQLWQAPNHEAGTEQLLERYYGRLVEWGSLLTKGDHSKAFDLVHDFCLHFALTRPDLSHVTNLNGYLYRSLRHIYLSNLARISRESLYLVSIADFDSAELALAPFQASDSLQWQNDLRKTCSYAAWRKAQTKSASYFILRFFHGYHHQEIADLARAPITAIISKFRLFRIETKAYLEDPCKLQFANRDLPPKPVLQWTSVSSFDLFKELRKTILDARSGECLPEKELLKPYSSRNAAPISCSLLSHIVSCERCLALIDCHLRRPTLKDREPLDQIDGNSGASGSGGSKPSAAMSRDRLLRSVRRLQTEAFQHRPARLSIAVDGKVIASHAALALQCAQAVRVENPENTRFIEVFSEQGVRLALVSIDELPPNGPHGISQHLVLSDSRWLDLSLSFDGLGLNIEVVYSDPTMALDLEDENESARILSISSRPDLNPKADSSVISQPQATAWLALLRQSLRPLTMSPVLNWSVAIACIACLAAYFALHDDSKKAAPGAIEILNQSIQAESASLRGQTEHQVFRFEETAADGSVSAQGTIDLWKDGDGTRYIRRLYDAQHHLIAAEGRQRDGSSDQYPKAADIRPSGIGRELLARDLWKLDVSSDAFRELNARKTAVRSTADGTELTAVEPDTSHAQILSATLVLDRHLHPIREVIHLRDESTLREVRFIQADYERRSSPSVPDAVFDLREHTQRSRVERPPVSQPVASDVQLAELHLAVLYQLSNLGADSRELIDVQETADRRVRVAGPVADDARKKEILAHLNQLEDHRLLELEIVSPQDLTPRSSDLPQAAVEVITTYTAQEAGPPAEAALRAYFQAQGLSHKALDAAVTGFSRDALKHSQSALREAGALRRLSNAFSAEKLRLVRPAALQQWTEMVARHASALEAELHALHEQLVPLSLSSGPSPDVPEDSAIETSAQFAGMTEQLFAMTTSLDDAVVGLFSSTEPSSPQKADIQSSINAALSAIPLQKAAGMSAFADRLNASGRMALIDQQRMNQ